MKFTCNYWKKKRITAGILLNNKTQQAQDGVLNASMYQQFQSYSEGNLAHLLLPNTSSFQMWTIKLHHDYVGPFFNDTVLYSTYYKFRYLENSVFLDTFHINRFKLVFISTPFATVILSANWISHPMYWQHRKHYQQMKVFTTIKSYANITSQIPALKVSYNYNVSSNRFPQAIYPFTIGETQLQRTK